MTDLRDAVCAVSKLKKRILIKKYSIGSLAIQKTETVVRNYML